MAVTNYVTVELLVAPGKELPDKLSDLLELALNDASKLNRDRYSMDSDVWHRNAQERYDGKCGVCLAGAVMARTLKVPHRATCELDNVSNDERRLYDKLAAIDFARMGRIDEALMCLADGWPWTDLSYQEERAKKDAFEASLTPAQVAILDKWIETDLNVWPYGPQDWDHFDETLPQYREIIAELRAVGW